MKKLIQEGRSRLYASIIKKKLKESEQTTLKRARTRNSKRSSIFPTHNFSTECRVSERPKLGCFMAPQPLQSPALKLAGVLDMSSRKRKMYRRNVLRNILSPQPRASMYFEHFQPYLTTFPQSIYLSISHLGDFILKNE